jgi:hypothetical protein
MLPALHFILPFSVLLALAGIWSSRFEFTREAVPPWRLFLPALFVFLCALILLLGLSALGKEVWVLSVLLGMPMGAARGLSLRLRTDHAAQLVRISPIKDGYWVALLATAIAIVDVVAAMGHGGASAASPLYSAGVAMCAGFLAGRSMALRLRARTAVHLDLR